MKPRGTLFVISAPSGGGKTSLIRRLVAELPGIAVSVSYTTRPPRPGEVDGRDYHFVDRETFLKMVSEGAFLEWAEIYGHLYGTARHTVEEALSKGLDLILEIDWQGARQVRERFSECQTIFILPPSLEALRERLRRRGQDPEEVMERRLREARREIAHCLEYDFLVVNDHFERALSDLKSIVVANRLRKERQKIALSELLARLGVPLEAT